MDQSKKITRDEEKIIEANSLFTQVELEIGYNLPFESKERIFILFDFNRHHPPSKIETNVTHFERYFHRWKKNFCFSDSTRFSFDSFSHSVTRFSFLFFDSSFVLLVHAISPTVVVVNYFHETEATFPNRHVL